MSSPNATPAALEPSGVRHRVVAFAATLAVITYVDRVCIAQAAPLIQEDLQLTSAQMGMAFSAFALAYALFEVPGGWLGDWIGPRKVLMRIVVMWSCFTAATGYAWNAVSLVLTRLFFGVGEAGCFPNLAKAFMIWLPPAERARAQAIMWLSARWAGALTPLLVIWVMSFISWRHTFVMFGGLGVIWAIFFYRSFRDRPRDHPEVNAAELALLEEANRQTESDGNAKVPWGRLLRNRSVWLLWLQYFCLTYGWFFYVTWLPTYLNEVVGVELNQNAFAHWLEAALSGVFEPDTMRRVFVAALAGVPLLFGGFGCIVCGVVSPRLAKRLQSEFKARRILAVTGFTGASVLLVASFYIHDPLLAMLAMGMASFSNDLTMPGSWNTCMDLGGRFAGTVSGSMNMMGALGAAVAPIVIGVILDTTGRDWAITFWLSGAIYFAGALCWLWLDPGRSIVANDTD